jgi:beta-1,4-mannosyl-glycoprotein beta-1,4-N-acetylglucosaminyltransferase
MKLIDSFTFFNEHEVLKLRLELLYHSVDQFVICESNVTHSGLKKDYNFLSRIDEYSEWIDKVTYIKYEPNIATLNFTKKPAQFDPSSPEWVIEAGQRNYLSTCLKQYDDGDIVFICDVDEIWNPEIASLIRSNQIPLEYARLEMQMHYYFLNCRGVGQANSKWYQPFFINISCIKNGADLSRFRAEEKMEFVGNAGWHFSYLGGAKRMSEKISAFAHQEVNTDTLNNIEHLEESIRLGVDYLGREDWDLAFHPVDYYPAFLSKIMRKYPHLLKKELL